MRALRRARLGIVRSFPFSQGPGAFKFSGHIPSVRLKRRKDELYGKENEAAAQNYTNCCKYFRVLQEQIPTVRRRCRSSRSNVNGMEITIEPKSETMLHWASSYWSDVTAEMTSFYKQNFKHLMIPINCKSSSKYSTVNEERSSQEKPDPVEAAQHHEWRAQHFEELPAWRQGNIFVGICQSKVRCNWKHLYMLHEKAN